MHTYYSLSENYKFCSGDTVNCMLPQFIFIHSQTLIFVESRIISIALCLNQNSQAVIKIRVRPPKRPG